MRRFAIGVLLVGGGIGFAVAPRGAAQAPPVARTQTPPFQAESWTNLPLTPNQPDKATHWSVEEMTRVHETLKTRAAKGEALNARSLMALPMTRTHGYTVGHRTSKDPVTTDQHDGVTDVFRHGWWRDDDRWRPDGRQTEIDRGRISRSSITGGDTFSLKPGDVSSSARHTAFGPPRRRWIHLSLVEDQRRAVSVAHRRGWIRHQ